MPEFLIRKEEATTNKTLKFPTSLLERAMVAAHDNDISFNKLVIQSLEFALDNLKSEPAPKPEAKPKRNRKRKTD